MVGVKAHLSKKTERKTPKGKPPKLLFPEKKSVGKGEVLSADKEKRTFRASDHKGKMVVTMRMD